MVFTDQPRAALDASSPTGMYPCDISDALACDFPATTPLVLASYARICAGESLDDSPRASGVIAYVIEGTGTTHCENEVIEWSVGDVMLFPGVVHKATAQEMLTRYFGWLAMRRNSLLRALNRRILQMHLPKLFISRVKTSVPRLMICTNALSR